MKKLLVISVLSVTLFGGVESAMAGYCGCVNSAGQMYSGEPPIVANCEDCNSACMMLAPEGTYKVEPGNAYCQNN